MAKPPAFQLYTSDWLTGTMFMDYDTKGRYIDLLCAQHQGGPLTQKEFEKIAGEKVEILIKKFKKNRAGKLYNKKLKEVIDKSNAYSKSRSINGSKGGRPRKDMLLNEKAYAKHTEDEVEVEDKDLKDLTKKEEKKEVFGEYENVMLTPGELEKLIERYPTDYQDRIERLSGYVASTGKKYKSHYATVNNWARKDAKEKSGVDFMDPNL